jgi:high-affinity iron transporter
MNEIVGSALATFVITLREGVEAALVVGIVLAFLQKAKQSELNSWVYGGIFAGVLVSAGIGGLFAGILRLLSTSSQPTAPFFKELLAGIFSTIAVGMLSWMLIWMTQQAKEMKAEVEGAIASALTGHTAQQAGWSIFILVFIAVAREGFETVIFITARLSQGLAPILGAIAGIVTATGIGALIFKWGVKINLRLFFQVMGVFLLLIVGGLLVSALKHLDVAISLGSQLQTPTAHWCWYNDALALDPSCNLGSLVWNFHDHLPDDRFPGLALKSLFGYRDRLYVVQLLAYIGFLLTIGGIYFRSLYPQASRVVSRNL